MMCGFLSLYVYGGIVLECVMTIGIVLYHLCSNGYILMAVLVSLIIMAVLSYLHANKELHSKSQET